MQSEGIELSYSDLLQIVYESWAAVLAFTMACGLVAGVIAFTMTPIYRAEIQLAPAPVESASGGGTLSRLAGQFAPLASLIGGPDTSGGLQNVQARLATLRSRHLAEVFIRENKLLPRLFPKRWDNKTNSWKLHDGNHSAPSMFEAVRMFDEDIRSISEDRRTGLITLAIEWRDPDTAARWCNELVARVNESLRKRVIEESKRSINFLEQELQKTSVVERQQIIYGLIESKTAEIMMANARKDYAFMVIDPAVVPLPNYFVRPRRLVIIAGGIFLGFIIGVAYASVRWVYKPKRVK